MATALAWAWTRILAERRTRRTPGWRDPHPAELQRLDYSQLGLGVTLTFSLKESLFKALYPLTRQRFYFEHAELLEWSVEGYARLRLLTDLSADWQAGRELEGQFCVGMATCSA